MARRPQFVNPFRGQRHPVADALQQIPGLVLQIQQQKAQQQQREDYIARQERQQQERMEQRMQLQTLDALGNLSRNANPSELEQLNEIVQQYQDNPYAKVVSAQIQGEQRATEDFQDTMGELQSLEERVSEMSQGTPDPQQSGEVLQALEKMAVTKKNLRSDQLQMVRERAKDLLGRAEFVDQAFRPLQGMDVDPETRGLQFSEGTAEPVRRQANLLKQRIERGNFAGAREAFNTLMRLESKLATTSQGANQSEAATVQAANTILQGAGVPDDQLYPEGTKVSFINQTIDNQVQKYGDEEFDSATEYYNQELEAMGSDERLTPSMTAGDQRFIFQRERQKYEEEGEQTTADRLKEMVGGETQQPSSGSDQPQGGNQLDQEMVGWLQNLNPEVVELLGAAKEQQYNLDTLREELEGLDPAVQELTLQQLLGTARGTE